MGVRDEDLTKISKFTGLNNRVKEPLRAPGVLREAENVDVTIDNKVRSRVGSTGVLVPCTMGSSLWADHEGLLPFALYADADELRALHPDMTTELLRSNLSIGLDVSYARFNDTVLWSNSVECGMVDALMENRPWACEGPSGLPDLSAVPGALGAGQVQVCVTFLDQSGRESGATLAAVIDLVPGEGVQLENIPQPNDPVETPKIAIYVTGGNDRVMYRAKTIPAGTSMTQVLQPPEGRPLATQFLTTMPPGHIVRRWNGRQLVARGRHLIWSPALRYGLTHVGHMNIGFRGELSLMEPIEGDGSGVYVCDGNRVQFLSGNDPTSWVPRQVGACGIEPGSAMQTPASAWGIDSKRYLPAWKGLDGLFGIGMPGGKIVTFNQSEFMAGVGERAASLFRESDGLMQFITVARGGRTRARMGVMDEAIARVYDEAGNEI